MRMGFPPRCQYAHHMDKSSLGSGVKIKAITVPKSQPTATATAINGPMLPRVFSEYSETLPDVQYSVTRYIPDASYMGRTPVRDSKTETGRRLSVAPVVRCLRAPRAAVARASRAAMTSCRSLLSTWCVCVCVPQVCGE